MRIFCLLIFLLGAAHALEPDEILLDPVLEKRARELSQTLRCPVCQNQTIDDSDAPLARDLRGFVRARLQAGDSDAEIRAALVARYGEFVLFRPAFGWRTVLLWGAPLLILLLGVWLGRRVIASPAPK